MHDSDRWRTEGVRVVRASDLTAAQTAPGAGGRATVFAFGDAGGQGTWIGSVVLRPGLKTGAHHHGHHEIALYVEAGRSEIRWGDRLEFAAEIGPGDWAYFPPYVPHQERNLSDNETLHFIVVRNASERIAVPLPGEVAEVPEIVA